MTDEELKQWVASLSVSQKETDQQLKELGEQIGGLGKKFGSFTEDLALPSMTKILKQRFRYGSGQPQRARQQARRRRGNRRIGLCQ